ncbi:hypothetical protein ACFL5A_05110, partial [Gemmatimonadota bacterium]
EGAHADVDVSSQRGSFLHPRTDLEETQRVLEIGEGAYMKEKGREAREWIRSNPVEYLELVAKRGFYFWSGGFYRPWGGMVLSTISLLALLGLIRFYPVLEPPQRAAILIPLATYPLVYYLVSYMPRYGQPLRWVLFLLAGAALWAWVGRGDVVRPGVETQAPPMDHGPSRP